MPSYDLMLRVQCDDEARARNQMVGEIPEILLDGDGVQRPFAEILRLYYIFRTDRGCNLSGFPFRIRGSRITELPEITEEEGNDH